MVSEYDTDIITHHSSPILILVLMEYGLGQIMKNYKTSEDFLS